MKSMFAKLQRCGSFVWDGEGRCDVS